MSALQIAKSIANFFAVGHNFNERQTEKERERKREREGEKKRECVSLHCELGQLPFVLYMASFFHLQLPNKLSLSS